MEKPLNISTKCSSSTNRSRRSSQRSHRLNSIQSIQSTDSLTSSLQFGSAEYHVTTNPTYFDLNEIHQAMLDASSEEKALSVFEGMYLVSLDKSLQNSLVTLIVGTNGLLELIVTLLRKYPVCITPLALALKNIAHVDNFDTSFFRLSGGATLIRSFPGSRYMINAYTVLLAKKKAAKLFAAAGGESAILEFLTKSDNSKIFCFATAVLIYNQLVEFPAKDAKVRSDLTNLLLAKLLKTNSSELLMRGQKNHDTFVVDLGTFLSVVGKKSDAVEPFCLCIQLLIATIDFVHNGSSIWLNAATHFASVLCSFTPTPSKLSCSQTTLFVGLLGTQMVPPQPNVLILHTLLKWIAQGFSHPLLPMSAIYAVSRSDITEAEQLPALHILLSCSNNRTMELTFSRLTPSSIEPSFHRYVRTASSAKSIRVAWISFVHIFSHIGWGNLDVLFRPLKDYIDQQLITEKEFKEFTRWPRNDEKDATLLQNIRRKLSILSEAENEEEKLRAAICAEWNEEIHAKAAVIQEQLKVLFSDPEYVAMLEMRNAAIANEAQNMHRITADLDELRTNIQKYREVKLQELKDSVQQQRAAAEKAHKAELEGIVWDPDELATKNAVHNSKLTRISKHFDKNSNDIVTFSNWRIALCSQIQLSIASWRNTLNLELRLIEKEEERIRGDGCLSTQEWFKSADSIIQQEQREREAIVGRDPFALMHLSVIKYYESFASFLQQYDSERLILAYECIEEYLCLYYEMFLAQLLEMWHNNPRLIDKFSFAFGVCLEPNIVGKVGQYPWDSSTTMGDLSLATDEMLPKSINFASLLDTPPPSSPSTSPRLAARKPPNLTIEVRADEDDEKMPRPKFSTPQLTVSSPEDSTHTLISMTNGQQQDQEIAEICLAIEEELWPSYEDEYRVIVEMFLQWNLYYLRGFSMIKFQHLASVQDILRERMKLECKHGERRAALLAEERKLRDEIVVAHLQPFSQQDQESGKWVDPRDASITFFNHSTSEELPDVCFQKKELISLFSRRVSVEEQERLRRQKFIGRWTTLTKCFGATLSSLNAAVEELSEFLLLETDEREKIIDFEIQWRGFMLNAHTNDVELNAPLFQLSEKERQYRGFIEAEEVVQLHQVLVYRPRGRKYRPIRDEEIEEKFTLSPAQQNRIKNWQRQVIYSADMPVVDIDSEEESRSDRDDPVTPQADNDSSISTPTTSQAKPSFTRESGKTPTHSFVEKLRQQTKSVEEKRRLTLVAVIESFEEASRWEIIQNEQSLRMNLQNYCQECPSTLAILASSSSRHMLWAAALI